MKQIRFFLLLASLLDLITPITAQTIPVKGKYNGIMVTMEYVDGGTYHEDRIVSLKYGDEDLTKKIADLNRQISDLNRQITDLKNKEGKKPEPKTDTAQERRMWNLQRDNNKYQRQVDTLQKRVKLSRDSVQALEESVRLLKDSVNMLKDSLEKWTDVAVISTKLHTNQYVGAYYRLGCPWLMNDLLNQKSEGEQLWKRQVKMSHQIGIFWNSAPLKNTPLSFGVGLEYSRMQFAAGIGHLSETVADAVDSDNCSYTARLTYDNVVEDATLHYLNVPITLSIGKPYNNKISGYFQITLVPSFCVAHSLRDTGNYSLAGHYSQLENTQVNLDLVDFPQLGFGEYTLSGKTKELSVKGFVLLGRVSGGVYIPMCNIRRGETSQWSVRLGVNLDFALSPMSKQLEPDPMLKGSSYRLNQCNILAGKGCRFVNPSLEVGILYIINTNKL